jgi:hypothetical protein
MFEKEHKEDLMEKMTIPPGFQDMMSFGLVEAILGRRSRRFFMGAEIPNGVFAYKPRGWMQSDGEVDKWK